MTDVDSVTNVGTQNHEWSQERQIQEVVRKFKCYRELENQETSFKPLPDNVIVAVAPKSGTTWLLHICHQLRMRGAELDFEYQTEVFTWIELAEKVFNLDPGTMPQPAKPHILATHLTYPLIPKGGRNIYCFRDQKDMLVSGYYYADWVFSLNGRVSLPNTALALMPQVEMNLNDLLLWWEHRHDDDILLFFFDDLLEDHTGSVHRIAKFIGVDCDEDTLARVVHTTTHAEMARHHRKFDTHAIAMHIAQKAGDTLLPVNERVERVRKDGGRSGDGRQLPAEIQQRVDKLWLDIVTPKLGFSNLQEMREAWHKEQLLAKEE